MFNFVFKICFANSSYKVPRVVDVCKLLLTNLARFKKDRQSVDLNRRKVMYMVSTRLKHDFWPAFFRVSPLLAVDFTRKKTNSKRVG